MPNPGAVQRSISTAVVARRECSRLTGESTFSAGSVVGLAPWAYWRRISAMGDQVLLYAYLVDLKGPAGCLNFEPSDVTSDLVRDSMRAFFALFIPSRSLQ